MNYKTTLILAVLFVLTLGAGLWFYRPGGDANRMAPVQSPKPDAPTLTRDLLDKKLGDVVKITVQRDGKAPWVFEKTPNPAGVGPGTWAMTSPLAMPVVAYEMDKFGRQLGGLRYELSYKTGEAGAVTAVDAGLQPPQAIVTLADADQTTATFELGRPASETETYIRLSGQDRIVVGKTNLKHLIKASAVEYRDQQVWTFAPEHATRAEIVDRSDPGAAATYVFVKDGARWMMESPVTARATAKVEDMIKNLSRLRVVKWLDEEAGKKPAAYGLSPATLTVAITVEEKEAIKDSAAEEPERSADEADSTPKSKVTIHQLHLSDLSPIGEETKTYLRVGDDAAVGTVMKATFDKVKPVMADWRDMRVTASNTGAAVRIDLSTPQGPAVLAKSGDRWSFETGGSAADATAVAALLKAVGELKAVAFVEGKSDEASSFGFDRPQADIRLTIPGVEGQERFTVGGYADANTKRLAYVRRGDTDSIAKVRVSDVAPLLQTAQSYADRTIIEVRASQIEKLTLDAALGSAGDRMLQTFERVNDVWTMASPAKAAVNGDALGKFVDAIGGLKALAVVGNEGSVSAYGLDAPAARIRITHKPPADLPPESSALPSVASQTIELAATEHDGKFYAKRADAPAIYQVAEDFYKQLFAEYRTTAVFDFDDAKVRQFSIRNGVTSHGFEKRGDRWTYEAEPDLPLDTKKVQNLLLQLKDLRTHRYTNYTPFELATFGLDTPSTEATATLEDGTRHSLLVSSKICSFDPDKGHYGAIAGRGEVFLLTPDMVRRLDVKLPDLEAPR